MKKKVIFPFAVVLFASVIFFCNEKVGNKNESNNIEQSVRNSDLLIKDNDSNVVEDTVSTDGQVEQTSEPQNNSNKSTQLHSQNIAEPNSKSIDNVVSKVSSETKLPVDANASYAPSNAESTFLQGTTLIQN